MKLELAGKTALVTGGSKGIGLAVVRLLREEGVRVVAGSRRPTPELSETGAHHVAADLTTAEDATRLVDEALTTLGGLDILVNNVGVGDPGDLARGLLTPFLELPDSAWQHTFDLHFYSALRVTRAALPSLVERSGTVVNVSSISANLMAGGPPDYNAAKAALNALTKFVAEQFGPQGVRALSVSPGPVSTDAATGPNGMIAQLADASGVDREQFLSGFLASLNPSTGRISTPEEVARLIVFAVSPTNLSGVDLRIDGGVVKTG